MNSDGRSSPESTAIPEPNADKNLTTGTDKNLTISEDKVPPTDDRSIEEDLTENTDKKSPPSKEENLPRPLNAGTGTQHSNINGIRTSRSRVCPHCRQPLMRNDESSKYTNYTNALNTNYTYTSSLDNRRQATLSNDTGLGGIKASHFTKSGRLISHLVAENTNLGLNKGCAYAHWNFWDLMLGTTEGQWCCLFMIGIFLLSAGTASWVAIGGNDEVKPTFFESSWLSWGLFFDPGTQTGIGAHEPFKVKCVALVFSVLGFIFNLAVLGLIVDQVRSQLGVWKEIRSRTVLNDHTLILGWSARTLFLLNQLLRAYEAEVKFRRTWCCLCCGCCRRRRRVLIMADEDAVMMQRETKSFLESINLSHKGVYFRRGDPTDWVQLGKASPAFAEDVIIMGASSGKAQDSDQKVLQILLALAALPRHQQVRGEVVAEMRIMENVAVAKLVLRNTAVIEPRYAANRMLCLAGISPAIGRFMDDLVSFASGDVLHLTPVPDILQGKTFEEASRALGNAVVIGVKAGQAGRVELVPDWNRALQPGDWFVTLAESKSDATLPTNLNDTNTDKKNAVLVSAACDLGRSNKDLSLEESKPDKVVCLIGCPSDFSELVEVMDSFCGAGSEVHILSERNERWREKHMQSAFAIEWKRSLKEWNNEIPIKVVHHFGPTTSYKHITESLPLERADCIFILSEREEGEDASAADCRSLNSLITLRRGTIEGDPDSDRLRGHCPIVCELVDARSEYVVNNSAALHSLCHYYHSNKIETALVSMCAEDRIIFNTLQILLEFTNQTDVIAVPLDYTLEEKEQAQTHVKLSFWDIQCRVQKKCGGILIGWYSKFLEIEQCGDAHAHISSEENLSRWIPDINPKNKDVEVTWDLARGHQLIVIRKEPDANATELLYGGDLCDTLPTSSTLPGMIDDTMS